MTQAIDSTKNGLFRFICRVTSIIEVTFGLWLLGWGIYHLQGNGWSLLFKGFGADIVAGSIVAAIATGLGLIIAAAGLFWMRRWPFMLHAPLILFYLIVFYLYLTSSNAA